MAKDSNREHSRPQESLPTNAAISDDEWEAMCEADAISTSDWMPWDFNSLREARQCCRYIADNDRRRVLNPAYWRSQRASIRLNACAKRRRKAQQRRLAPSTEGDDE